MTRAKQKRELEIELKLLIRKYYEMGNDALGLDGGDPVISVSSTTRT